MSAKSMKKAESVHDDTETMRPEYRREDLGRGVRGKYAADVRRNSNLVLLAPDVAEVFETPRAVNDALRSLITVARRTTARASTPTRRTHHPRRSKAD